MKPVLVRDAKNSFGKFIDDALVGPVAIEKHGVPVVVVLSMEDFKKLKSWGDEDQAQDRYINEAIRAASPQQHEE